MNNALLTAVSGMLAEQLRLDAVGNNIANANTTAFKSERVLFADALYQIMGSATAPSGSFGGTNPSALGQGVIVNGTDTDFAQGSLQSTGRSLDVAVEGQGFIAVTDGTHIF